SRYSNGWRKRKGSRDGWRRRALAPKNRSRPTTSRTAPMTRKAPRRTAASRSCWRSDALCPSPQPSPPRLGEGSCRLRRDGGRGFFIRHGRRVPSPRSRGEGQGEGFLAKQPIEGRITSCDRL